MKQYLDLVRHVLAQGTRRPNRTGVGTALDVQPQLRDRCPRRLPAPHHERRSAGRTSSSRTSGSSPATRASTLLKKHKCKFTGTPWADENGRVLSAYGNYGAISHPRRVEAKAGFSDQIRYVIEEAKKNPMSRRAARRGLGSRQRANEQASPCHAMFVLNVQLGASGDPYLNLHLTQRSADVALGVPYNIAGHALTPQSSSRASSASRPATSATPPSTRTSTRRSQTARWRSTTTSPGS